MFIKDLWKFSRVGAAIFILYIFFWFFINYKQGATATPVTRYSMFSKSMSLKDTLSVLELYVNNKRLDLTKYSLAERDLMQTCLAGYLVEKNSNEEVYYSIKNVFNKAGIGSLMKKEMYSNAITAKEFEQWYKKMISKIVGYPVDVVTVYYQAYLWKSNSLQPVADPVKINLDADR
ncbi:hypothetical protein [Ferruginibacter albus]|uniref:hypothetical protein n=1 Tax=Ferruginibacter albus TaxID=2875540 RepID=UPI001CC42C6A|nr:hypothetical protein [Ferruginibacter albus]UAY53385.1 hypothetical protein K9M53_06855 [Ferruginibacter albus]